MNISLWSFQAIKLSLYNRDWRSKKSFWHKSEVRTSGLGAATRIIALNNLGEILASTYLCCMQTNLGILIVKFQASVQIATRQLLDGYQLTVWDQISAKVLPANAKLFFSRSVSWVSP